MKYRKLFKEIFPLLLYLQHLKLEIRNLGFRKLEKQGALQHADLSCSELLDSLSSFCALPEFFFFNSHNRLY